MVSLNGFFWAETTTLPAMRQVIKIILDKFSIPRPEDTRISQEQIKQPNLEAEPAIEAFDTNYVGTEEFGDELDNDWAE